MTAIDKLAAMKIEQRLASHIGSLVIENMRLLATIDALKAEIAKKDELIQQLGHASAPNGHDKGAAVP